MTDIRHAQHSAPQLLTEVFMVYGSLRTGGIETLIVRVANFLSRLVHVFQSVAAQLENLTPCLKIK